MAAGTLGRIARMAASSASFWGSQPLGGGFLPEDASFASALLVVATGLVLVSRSNSPVCIDIESRHGTHKLEDERR